jgi:hypothetical protein
MIRLHHAFLLLLASAILPTGPTFAAGLPFSTVFKDGGGTFERLLHRAHAENWGALPIGQRTATVGRALCGTPYKNYTLEIDDRIEAASVNLDHLDCWTFFEASLAFARMLGEPVEKQTRETMLGYIELDRYRNGKCTGEYLSRLHYLEDWFYDNAKRGLIRDMSAALGGQRMPHIAREMTVGWKSYRYLKSNPGLLPELARHEARITAMRCYYIPKRKVASIESKLQTGDIIGIVSKDGRYLGTSHVGLAYRDSAGALRFMHASAPRNYGKVVLDQRLSGYLNHFRSHAGIMVARPLK